MKIKVAWEKIVEGISEIEVPEAEVVAWLNENGLNNGETTVEQVTAADCFEWLQAGDEEIWAEQIDIERDEKPTFWNAIKLERLSR